MAKKKPRKKPAKRKPTAKPTKPAADRYRQHRQKMGARIREQSQSGRDIGEIPKPANARRRKRCAASLRLWCETYHSGTFTLAWSADHLRVIAKLETAIKKGGQRAVAMPRGSGKTSLCEAGALFALLAGYRRYVALIGAEKGHATEMLESIRTELETNDLLLADFPEVCFPIACLEGVSQRRLLYHGKSLRMKFTEDKIVLPWVEGSNAAGSVVQVAGITGRIRGMKRKLPNGETLRPDLAIPDDPQTDESARSQTDCERREKTVAGAVLGLAGPQKRIAALMPCTVIQPGDMADKILDRQLHPEWNGERTKLVDRFPKRMDLWDEYGQVRAEGMRNGDDGKAGDAFYRKRRKAMDAGAKVAWPERHPGAISAIQYAMNLKLDDEPAFFAEYQNEPLSDEEPDDDLLTADQIAAKINRLPRGRVPLACTRLTAFIDVQGKLLFFGVAGWDDDFTGAAVDYGTFPDQKRLLFTKRNAQRTLGRLFPGTGQEGQIYAGLEALCEQLLGAEWKREDGAVLRIDRCLIDANWGLSTDVVYQFCRQSAYASILFPSHGKGFTASSLPMHEYKRKPGDRVGHNWRIPNVRGKRAVRHVLFDANFWKSFLQARLAVAMGDPGCFSLFGTRASKHALLAKHLTAEYRVRTEGRGRTVDEWKLPPDKPDNDWLDVFVGCAVGAGIEGCELKSAGKALVTGAGKKPQRKKLKLSELRAGKRRQ